MEMELWYNEITNDTHGLALKVRRQLHHEVTEFQTIDVLETHYHGNLMVIDGVVMLTENDEFVYHESIVHVPMQLLERPERVLVIGGGDGGTARELLKYPSVREVVLVEIDGAVVEVAKRFFPGCASSFSDGRLTLKVEDGAKYVKEAEGPFDLVIVDSTDPVGPGEVLFSERFYRGCARLLKPPSGGRSAGRPPGGAPGGALVAQTESPFDRARRGVIGKIYGNLRKAFSDARMYLAGIPTYPFGIWSFGFCSDAIDPVNDPFRAPAVPEGLKYYNRELGRGVFALPNYARELVDG